MNSKTTWSLLILALGLFAFIYFFERRLPTAEERLKLSDRLLPAFSPERVASIEVRQENRLIRVERTNDAWWLTAPIRYPAQAARIDNLLASLGQLRRQPVLSAGELLERPQAPSEFGIDPPRVTVVLATPSGRRELLFGRETPAGAQVYFQLVGTPGIFVAGNSVSERIPATANDWRDTALLSLRGRNFNRIRVQSGPQGFELEFDGGQQHWLMVEPVRTRADSRQVSDLLLLLQNAQVQQFLEADAAAPEISGLNNPEAVLWLGQGTNELVQVQFGRSPTNQPGLVYARRSDQSALVLVPKGLVDLLRRPYLEFRDRQLVPLNVAEVESIRVRAAEDFTVVRQTNRAWRVTQPVDSAADPQLMQEFFSALASLKIIGFEKEVVTDFSKYGLEPPARQYTLLGRPALEKGLTNQVLGRVEFGSNLIEHVDQVYARRNDESSVYTASYADSLGLPKAAFQLRDRQLWNFDAAKVVSLTLTESGQTRKFTRNLSGDWSLPEEFKTPLNPFAVNDVVDELCHLRAEAWVENQSWETLGFDSTARRISLELNSGTQLETVHVDFGRMGPSRRPYAAVVLEGRRVIFEFPLLVNEKIKEYLTPQGTAGL